MLKGKSIKGKILISVLALLSGSLLFIGIVSILLLYFSSQQNLEMTITEMSELAAERVSQEIKSYENVAYELGCNALLSSDSVSVETKKEFLDKKVETYNLVEAVLIKKDGMNFFNGVDSSEREYFKVAMNGEFYISAPSVSQTTGEITMFLSAPLWKDGIPNSIVEGVVLLIPQEDFLDNIVKTIEISENSGAYILDAAGTAVAHTTEGLVADANNSVKRAQTDSSLTALAALETKMISGQTGFGKYRYNGVSKILGYAPIPDTDGWSLGVMAPSSDFLSATVIAIIITMAVVIISILVAVFIIRRIADAIGKPIKLCAARLDLLAQGDLKTPVPEIHADDETGMLAESTAGIVKGLEVVLGDVNYLLGEMANGNFAISTTAEDVYIGDFEALLLSMRKLNRSLSKTLFNIEEVANQVSLGSVQMAEGATALAEGATDQAGVVQELLATVEDVTEKSKVGAGEATSTSSEARKIAERAGQSSAQMKEMTTAMERISDASKEIANIIKTIEGIATQTNLLSLNASIEAARAGEFGKGFAVVAGEIGTLATQSGEAVDDTRKLIETALSEVSTGTQMVDFTADTLKGIIEAISEVGAAIESVSSAFEQQAEAIAQINLGVEQISVVVQNNSATAQESSATSQELSAQAQSLEALVRQFKLREDS